MMTRLLCPSMMCADFSNLQKEVEELDNSGADIFHVDIMDGHFVPNFGMGIQDFSLIRSSTEKEVDVHLMIQDPSRYVELFADLGADIIYVHPESDQQISRTLEMIRKKDKKVGIAINPGTSIFSIQELLPLIDYLMIMTVNPGFAGQQYLDYVKKKLEYVTSIKQQYKFQVMVDGAISAEKITSLDKIGVDGFVLGTSALFGKKESYEKILNQLHE
ncbi:ribulose-phosphate 3-epimerase [Enterococcus sp. LJL99]